MSELPNEAYLSVALKNGTPMHLWVRTCGTPNCRCRSALVVAHASAEHLRGEVVARSGDWFAGKTTAESYGDLAAFDIDIDSQVVSSPNDVASPFSALPEGAASIAGQLSSGTLDQIARIWARGKGVPAKLFEMRQPSELLDWKPGQLLGWGEVYPELRGDVFEIDGIGYLAVDQYCVNPSCDCGEVRINFEDVDQRTPELVGYVLLSGNGTATITNEGPIADRTATLWAAYRRRHGNFQERIQERRVRMREYGEPLHAWYAETHQPQKWVSSSRKRRKSKA